MGGAFWSAVTHGRYCEQKRLSSSHSPERAFGRLRSSQKHFPTTVHLDPCHPPRPRARSALVRVRIANPHPILITCAMYSSIFACVTHTLSCGALVCRRQRRRSIRRRARQSRLSRVRRKAHASRPLVRGLGHGQVARRHRAHVHRQLWHHARWCKR